MGHGGAMVALGTLLRHGHGVSRDEKAAFAWFSEAARRDHVEAMWMVGVAHLEGFAAEAADDHGAARRWLTKAAAFGSADAFHWLGVMAEYGLGLDGAKPDFKEALESYKVAASKGHDAAAFHLGLLYAYGRGCNQDLPRAVLIFQDGARNKHAGSMYYLGQMTLYGQGVPVDYDVARYWFQRAETANDPAFSDLAAEARRELETSLQMAEDYFANHEAEMTERNEPPPGLKYAG